MYGCGDKPLVLLLYNPDGLMAPNTSGGSFVQMDEIKAALAKHGLDKISSQQINQHIVILYTAAKPASAISPKKHLQHLRFLDYFEGEDEQRYRQGSFPGYAQEGHQLCAERTCP